MKFFLRLERRSRPCRRSVALAGSIVHEMDLIQPFINAADAVLPNHCRSNEDWRPPDGKGAYHRKVLPSLIVIKGYRGSRHFSISLRKSR